MTYGISLSSFLMMGLVVSLAAADNDQRTLQPVFASPWTGGNPLWREPQVKSRSTTPVGSVRYGVAPIGVLPGKTASFLSVSRAVNNLGHVTGYSYIYAGNIFTTGQGFVWQHGRLEALPLLTGWAGAFAFSINDQGQVAGAANRRDSFGNIWQTAVLWDGGRPRDLGTLQPNSNAAALDVNVWGVAVGESTPRGNVYSTPVVWRDGHPQALPLLPWESGGVAQEINDLGVISGYQISALDQIPCLWFWNGSSYKPVYLGTLGGLYGTAFGINNLNEAVGFSTHAGYLPMGPPFQWDRQSGIQPLSLPPFDTDGVAYNINDLGQIVGDGQLFNSDGTLASQTAMLWENGTFIDLQIVVPEGTAPLTYRASNINNRGDIALNGTNPDGSPVALLLVAKSQP